MSADIFNKTLEEFESEYSTEETEILFLTTNKVTAALSVGNNHLRPILGFSASVDLQTGEFSKDGGVLEWLVPRSADRKGWIYDFKKFGIYHIRCRKNVSDERKSYMVTGLIDDGATDPRLDKLRAKLLKSVYIDDPEIGRLTLNKEISCFECTIELHDHKCSVELETDRDGGKTAKKALAHLKTFVNDISAWDEKFRQYAASELMKLATEWDISATAEQFADAIILSELSIDPQGEIIVIYDDTKGFFGGHAIEISANIKGKIVSVDIVG